MSKHGLFRFLPLTAILSLSLVFTGCAGSNDNDSAGVLDPVGENLEGTWLYRLNNAYEAAFTDCTGDAEVLEGKSFVQGMALAPICVNSISFDVMQQGSTLTMLTQSVSCSDGAVGSVAGVAAIAQSALNGQWKSVSSGGVSATQSFSGSMIGGSLEIEETARVFEGTFEGSCLILPPLNATVVVKR